MFLLMLPFGLHSVVKRLRKLNTILSALAISSLVSCRMLMTSMVVKLVRNKQGFHILAIYFGQYVITGIFVNA